jgi:hypothetical protein
MINNQLDNFLKNNMQILYNPGETYPERLTAVIAAKKWF